MDEISASDANGRWQQHKLSIIGVDFVFEAYSISFFKVSEVQKLGYMNLV